MAKRHPFKKAKPGEPIPVTARELESSTLEHNGRFNSRDYDKLERMKLMELPVCDAIHELKTYSLENTSIALRRAPFGAWRARICEIRRRRRQVVLLFPRVHFTRAK